MNIKQLFCKHIWLYVKDDFLRAEREMTMLYNARTESFFWTKKYYARYMKCIKCGKETIEEITSSE